MKQRLAQLETAKQKEIKCDNHINLAPEGQIEPINVKDTNLNLFNNNNNHRIHLQQGELFFFLSLF